MDTSCKKAKHNHQQLDQLNQLDQLDQQEQQEQQEQLDQLDQLEHVNLNILDKIADVWLNSRDDKNFLTLMIKQNKDYYNNAKAKFKVHLQCMLKHVKKNISESQLLKDKKKQKHFDRIIEQTINFQTDNGRYCSSDDNKVQQIIILLYLTKDFDIILDLDCLKTGVDNSCIKYFKIVSPMLNKLTKLKINDYEQGLIFSLEFVELLLSFPNLQILDVHFTTTDKEFELPKQKLKIKDLCIVVSNHDIPSYTIPKIPNTIYSIININRLLTMCPELTKLDLSCDYIKTDEINLIKLGEILNQCNNLTNLTLSDQFESLDEYLHDVNLIVDVIERYDL